MQYFKLIRTNTDFAKLQEEYRKVVRRERRLRKLMHHLEMLLDRELKRQECEELPTISF
jgi:hypothetical protein